MNPKNIVFSESNRKNKKYRVDFDLNGQHYVRHFGNSNYQHFMDNAIGLFSYLNHYDPIRRDKYLRRSVNIRDKSGQLTYLNPLSPNYWSIHYLW